MSDFIRETRGADMIMPPKEPTVIQVTGDMSAVPVNRDVLEILMKKGEAYNQVKHYLEQNGPDGRIVQQIRNVVSMAETMMEE